MRLLYLIPDGYPTFRPDIAVLFGNRLHPHGVATDLVGFQAGALQAADGGWPAGRLLLCADRGGRAGRHLISFVHFVRCLLRADASAYDAFQVRNMPVVALLALVLARWKGVRFFYWMSYPVSEGQIDLARQRGLAAGVMRFVFPWLRGRIGVWVLYRWVLPRADHVFVQSAQMLRDVVACGVAADRMTAVPMGVDVAAIDQCLAGLQRAPHPTGVGPTLGYLGTLDRARRIEVLFGVLARVRRHHPQARLALVGDAGDEAHIVWLKQQAQAAGIADAVDWLGWVPTAKGWQAMAQCELAFSLFPRGFLLDSASPTKVPEYLALGTAVVCNDNPDQAEVMARTGAGLCVPLDEERLATAALEILSWAPAEHQSRMAAGRAYVVAERNYDKIGASLASVYSRLRGRS